MESLDSVDLLCLSEVNIRKHRQCRRARLWVCWTVMEEASGKLSQRGCRICYSWSTDLSLSSTNTLLAPLG
jgi:hypothetical protein